MYGGFDVYKTYLGVKLHFTTKTYDFVKYGGKVNASLESFTKRKDRYFFHKLSTRYRPDDILDFFIANFIKNSKGWAGDLLQSDGKDTFMAYKKYKEAFTYHFRNDCVLVNNLFNDRGLSFDDGFRVFDGQHPRFLRLLLQGRITYQTAVAFQHHLSYLPDWNVQIKENVVWPEIAFKITKLKPFVKFNFTETKLIMREVFTK